MKRNRTPVALALLLLSLSLLATGVSRIFAAPLSPYIMITPEKTINPALTPGSQYVITISTDYTGNDVWAWQFSLTFNPAVLQGYSLANGNLINDAKHTSAEFMAGAFDNIAGTLSLTGAYFSYTPPAQPFTTSGPGTLAQVTFNVVGYGSSDIQLVETDTQLVGYLIGITYEIIAGYYQEDQLGHGFFSNKLIGDANSDTKVDAYDLYELGKAYGSIAGPPPSSNWNSDCDFNHDFVVNRTDLSDFRSNYGTSI